MEEKRTRRISSLLRRGLANILRRESGNFLSRGLLTVTLVKVSRDGSLAKVYISLYAVDDKEGVMGMLHERKGKIRKVLGAAFGSRMRKVPELRFILDETDEKSEQINSLVEGR